MTEIFHGPKSKHPKIKKEETSETFGGDCL